MKNLLFLALLALFTVSCGQGPAGENVEAGEAVETNEPTSTTASNLAVDTEASTIHWTGAKVIGKTHTGTIDLRDGQLTIENGELTGGTFVIDMTSIEDTDMEGGGKERLEGHLASADFFDVENHPTATFTIAEVAPATDREDATHLITGNLTMKGITKSITIPAGIKIGESGVSAATPDFVIDRTAWDVMYNASVLGTVKDDIINDEIGLRINLMAK